MRRRCRSIAERARAMKFTDIFIRRPVLATVVSLMILVLGLRAYGCCRSCNIRAPRTPSSPSPRSIMAPIPTWCPASSPRRWRTPSRSQRHRLHELDQPERREHDLDLSAAQLRFRQGADRDQHQGQLGLEPAAARLAAADAHRQGRPDHRRHVYRLQQRRAGLQPDHRLPGAVVQPKLQAVSGVQTAELLAPRCSRCAPGSIRRSSPPSG